MSDPINPELNPYIVDRVMHAVGSRTISVSEVFESLKRDGLLYGLDPARPKAHVAYILRAAKTSDGRYVFEQMQDGAFYRLSLMYLSPSERKTSFERVLKGFLDE